MGNHGVWADDEISCITINLATIHYAHINRMCTKTDRKWPHQNTTQTVYTKSLPSSPNFFNVAREAKWLYVLPDVSASTQKSAVL